MEQRLDDAEGRHDDLEQDTRQFCLVIHGISEREAEDNVENVIELGKLLNVNLTRNDVDIVHRMNTKSTPSSYRSFCKLQRQETPTSDIFCQARIYLNIYLCVDKGAISTFCADFC